MDVKGILIKVLIGVLVAALVATGGYFLVNYFISNKNNDPSPNDDLGNNTEIVTNRHNQAILDRVLTTSNYSGAYRYSNVAKVTFNEYDKDTNPGGLKAEDIETLIANKGIVGGFSAFNKYLADLKKEEVYGTKDGLGNVITEGTNEVITISTPVGENGQTSTFGVFTIAKAGGILFTGKLYGDENLGYASTSDGTSSKNLFISLNYTTVEDAVDATGEKQDALQTIYIFEDVYSKNNPSLRLFTVTYEYKLKEEDPSHPKGDLDF